MFLSETIDHIDKYLYTLYGRILQGIQIFNQISIISSRYPSAIIG